MLHLYLCAVYRYEHRLIDDMVAYCIKSNGGFVWACKNYVSESHHVTLRSSVTACFAVLCLFVRVFSLYSFVCVWLYCLWFCVCGRMVMFKVILLLKVMVH